jgi:hypothetical protein
MHLNVHKAGCQETPKKNVPCISRAGMEEFSYLWQTAHPRFGLNPNPTAKNVFGALKTTYLFHRHYRDFPGSQIAFVWWILRFRQPGGFPHCAGQGTNTGQRPAIGRVSSAQKRRPGLPSIAGQFGSNKQASLY